MLMVLRRPPTIGQINELITNKSGGTIVTTDGVEYVFTPDFDLQPQVFKEPREYTFSGTVSGSNFAQKRATLTILAFGYRGTRKATIQLIED